MAEQCKKCGSWGGTAILQQYATIIDGNNTKITLPRLKCKCGKSLNKQTLEIEKFTLRLLAKYGAKFEVRNLWA